MTEKIVWIDAEFSGTSPQSDELLEVAAIMTDLSGRVIGSPFEALYEVPKLSRVIENSDEIVQRMHDKSGLWQDLWCGKTMSPKEVEKSALDWLDNLTDSTSTLYFGGNSLTKDRNFIELNLPEFYSRLSFRSMDATSIAILLNANTNIPKFMKVSSHRALDDVWESVDEYQHYVKWLQALENN